MLFLWKQNNGGFYTNIGLNHARKKNKKEIVLSIYLGVIKNNCLQVENKEPESYNSSKLLRRGKKLEDNNNLSKEDEEYINYRKLLKYEQAPAYLQHNPFIRDGYRKLLPTRLCWERYVYF